MQIRLREKRLFRLGQLFLPLLHFLVLKCFHGFIFFLLLQSKLSAMPQEGKSMETVTFRHYPLKTSTSTTR